MNSTRDDAGTAVVSPEGAAVEVGLSKDDNYLDIKERNNSPKKERPNPRYGSRFYTDIG